MLLKSLLVALTAIAAGVNADYGTIQCADGSTTTCIGGSCFPIPAHRIQLSIDGQSCWGPLLADSCAQMKSGEHDGTTKYACGREVDFWRTSDGCWNLEIDGTHAYCCGTDDGCSWTD